MDWTIVLAFFAGGVAVGAAVTEWMGWPLHRDEGSVEERNARMPSSRLHRRLPDGSCSRCGPAVPAHWEPLSRLDRLDRGAEQ